MSALHAPEFGTERVNIGLLDAADSSALFRYRSSSEVQRFQPWSPSSEGDVADFIARQDPAALTMDGGRLQLAVRERTSGELVGDLGLHMVGPEGVQVEVGFTIDPAHQRKGLASDAVSALLTWLFGELGKHRVLASTDPSNSASIALLTNLGFRQEAHHHQSYRFRGAWVDDLVFAMLRREWLERGTP